ncbi:MAG: hypothetical protein U5N55_11210 [Cypionkella sp.]|nr:hypothetical protein [Cypionkella sp.]
MLRRLWKWLDDHSHALQGLGAGVTAAAALVALVIIPWQIRAAEQIQLRQAARDMYRGFVQLTLERPAIANADYCALKTADDVTAYESYMEFFLYTAEHNMLVAPDDWRAPLMATMTRHKSFFCAFTEWDWHEDVVQEMIFELRKGCSLPAPCAQPLAGP